MKQKATVTSHIMRASTDCRFTMCNMVLTKTKVSNGHGSHSATGMQSHSSQHYSLHDTCNHLLRPLYRILNMKNAAETQIHYTTAAVLKTSACLIDTCL